jgi:hypothetical protein
MQSLRSDVAAVVAVRASAEGSGAAEVDLSPLSKQLDHLTEHVAAIAAAPRAEGGPAVGGEQDVDAAITAAERRLMAHVDDAIFALAQTLLGRGGAATAAVDVPAPAAAEPVAPATPSVAAPTPAPSVAPASAPAVAAGDVDEDEYDETDVDEYDDESADVAQVDFSQVDLDDEDDDDTTSWQRPDDDDDEDEDEDGRSPHWGQAGQPRFAGGQQGSAPVPGVDAPFDQEAWGPPPLPVPPEGPSTVVPERRRRWFSW